MIARSRSSLLLLTLLVVLSALPTASWSAEASGKGPFFDVKAFGARGDGRALDSDAINAAIAAAGRRGGGTVLVPPGTYVSASIRLKSHVTLLLEPRVTIEAVDWKRAPYDLPEPNEWGDQHHYQDFGHSHWKNSLIWGVGLEDVAILGPGRIDGKGLNPGFDRLADTSKGEPVYRDGGPGEGNKAIALRECRNVLLRRFEVRHGGHFAILAPPPAAAR